MYDTPTDETRGTDTPAVPEPNGAADPRARSDIDWLATAGGDIVIYDEQSEAEAWLQSSVAIPRGDWQ
jgi:hypothetical protein